MLLAIDVGNTETVIGLFSLGPGDDPPAGQPARPAGPARAGRPHPPLAAVDGRPTARPTSTPCCCRSCSTSTAWTSTRWSRAWPSPRRCHASPPRCARWRSGGSTCRASCSSPACARACRSSTTTPRRSAPTASPTPSAPMTSTAGPCIVVDLGTATTFDAISATGEYLGGAIAPGIAISMDALFHHAAALRRVELVEPRSVIGKSTVESIQSGALYGYAAQVDGMCRRIIGRARARHGGGHRRAVRDHRAVVADHRAPRAVAHVARAAPRLRAQLQARRDADVGTTGSR